MVKRLTACFLLALMLLTAVFPAGAESAAEAETASVRLSDEVLLSFYDNSVFFGDSIMQGFRRYRSNIRQTDKDFLEGVTVMATSSISLYDASRRYQREGGTFLHRGVQKTMYNITRELKPDRIFILLGLNDVVGIKIDKAISWVEYIIQYMPEYSADTEIYFFSQTPVTALYGRKRERPNYPSQVDQYNLRLKETCEKLGAHYVEISEPLKDADGYLDAAYTSDGDCHLSDAGVAVWIQAMCDYAQSQYDQGLWTPADMEKGE